ncbi:hypothetical protein [Caulobacter sp. 17J80-11]|uniref:hypothetical protein n=1 Tax=Caulobacter sp. 17J80-11 TaxID=2763502 RepID=UPI0016534D33|nr:hypothetical protein [Caulobacter sp. 17J80-11]MBC6983191.1 hypothetical protein [Caulobacter sp. 17J80-11]
MSIDRPPQDPKGEDPRAPHGGPQGSRTDRAEARAEAYAPRPHHTAFISGVVGCTVTVTIFFAVGSFFDVFWLRRALTLVVVGAVGFVASYVMIRRQGRAHRKAAAREYRDIGEEERR